MNIGIDIDDTITNSSQVFVKYARIYNKEKNISYQIDTSELNQNKAFGWSLDNSEEFRKLYLRKILEEAEVNKHAVKVIDQLKQNNYNIYFITARTDEEVKGIYDLTEKWLIKNKVLFDKLIVNSIDKTKVCQEYKIDLFIDDSYFNCKNVFENLKIPVFMFETNYNKQYLNLPFERVKDWNEILIKIKEMMEDN